VLGRYHIQRGRPLSALPERVQKGRRMDTRKHTRHCLRPLPDMVAALLSAPPPRRAGAWRDYERKYRALIAERFARDRRPFDALARTAREGDVFLGCSCPSAVNPDPSHCHVVLALQFMRRHYPSLRIASGMASA
jgi:hypothetical protein